MERISRGAVNLAEEKHVLSSCEGGLKARRLHVISPRSHACVCVWLCVFRAAELMTRTGSVVTLEVAKQGAIYHGLATLLNQPSPMMQRCEHTLHTLARGPHPQLLLNLYILNPTQC